jgi:hypothetical protein
MPRSVTSEFTDPVAYQAARLAENVDLLVAGKGRFRAALTHINFDRLWMEYGEEELPYVASSTLRRERAVIAFLSDCNGATIQHCGIDMGPGEIIVIPPETSFHLRTWGPTRWQAMSLAPDDLAAASHAVVGRDQIMSSVTRVARPHSTSMARLARLQGEGPTNCPHCA